MSTEIRYHCGAETSEKGLRKNNYLRRWPQRESVTKESLPILQLALSFAVVGNMVKGVKSAGRASAT